MNMNTELSRPASRTNPAPPATAFATIRVAIWLAFTAWFLHLMLE
jgi:hypothetical protein